MPVPAEVGAAENSFEVFTVAEVAEMLKLSDDAARNLFQHEPGVLAIGRPRSEGKRGYLTLRIPRDVFMRVFRRLQRP